MIISRTPLRISFAGGGTDLAAFYNQEPGEVVSATINKYVYVILNPHFEGGVRLSYSKTENVRDPRLLQHDIVREILLETGLDNVEIVTVADIPGRGTGLGSSSALCVGLLKAISAWHENPITKQDLAENAFYIESARCGKTLGKQDHYASAFGGVNHMVFGSSVSVDEYLPPHIVADELNERLVMFYTGVTRQAESILVKQSESIREGEIKTQMRQIRVLAATLARDFEVGEFDNLGEILHAGWMLKREITIQESVIDDAYEYLLGAGALGGKLLGAGGGGFLLVALRPGTRTEFLEAVKMFHMKPVPFKISNYGSAVVYDNAS